MGEESRRKRRWDQPDIFPVKNVGFFPINQLTSNLKPQDELVIAREIVINDAEASVRYKLTRRQTQEEIQKCTGAVVITRGKYRPPNAMPDGEKPLYLHVSAGAHLKETAEKIIAVDRAATLVEEMMKPTLKDQYINHIMNETGVTVLLRGHGSGHLEEGEQPLHLFLSSNSPKSLEEARLLVENLLDTISRECGLARVAPVKVYAAVPPPQNLLIGVHYPGLEGNSSLISTPLASVVANCSAAPSVTPAVNPGVSTACMYGPAAQAVQANGLCYSQPSLGIGSGYNGYGGIYPQATPFQQVALALRQIPPTNTATSASVSTSSVNDKRPPQKRKFKELPAASKGAAVTHQDLILHCIALLVPEDPGKSLLGKPGNVTAMPPVQAKYMLPPVPKFSSSPTKSIPPPPPKFNSTPSKNMPPPPPKLNSTASVHRCVSTTDVNSRKSIPEKVPDTLVRLMEYGEDDDDDPD
ncbi:hypothetical protein V2J09_003950 [Rumex salicifolius]